MLQKLNNFFNFLIKTANMHSAYIYLYMFMNLLYNTYVIVPVLISDRYAWLIMPSNHYVLNNGCLKSMHSASFFFLFWHWLNIKANTMNRWIDLDFLPLFNFRLILLTGLPIFILYYILFVVIATIAYQIFRREYIYKC